MTRVVSAVRALIVRLGAFVGIGPSDRDIDDELRAHRAFLEDDYRRAGLDPVEARRRAAIDFGSVASIADAYRDRRDLIGLEHWRRDVMYAARSLGRSAGLAVSAVLVLGFGIGLSTAIAAIFHSVVWQGLPVPEPERVVKLSLTFAGKGSRRVSGIHNGFSYPELTAYRHATRTLDGLAGVREERVTWQRDATIESLAAAQVTGDYFQTLRVRSVRGRLLTPAESRQPVAVVSFGFWQRVLDGSDDALGRSLVLDRTPYVVIGVAEQGFGGTAAPIDVWLPLEAAKTAQHKLADLTEENYAWLEVIGRLTPGASIGTAIVESPLIANQFDRDNPGRRTTVHIERAARLPAGTWSTSDRTIVLGAGGAIAVLVGVLLLICGSNVASLLLSRAASRQKEIAVRVALGASRRRITQQLLAEVLILALGSALVGVVVCSLAFHLLAVWFPIADLIGTLNPDGRVLTVALTFAIGVLLVFGLLPMHQTTNVDCLPTLKGDGMFPVIRVPTMRLRRMLISMQVALSLILLLAAALMSRGLERAFSVDLGYPTNGLYLVELDRASAEGTTLGRAVRDALARQPGIDAVGLAGLAPFSGSGVSSARTPAMREPVSTGWNRAEEGYFRALGIPLLTGRFPLPSETDVVVVNSRFARRFWRSEHEAVGQPLEIPGRQFDPLAFRSVRVIGVIGAVQTSLIGVPDAPMYYEPIDDAESMHRIVIRVRDQTSGTRIVVDTVRALDSRAMVTVHSLDEQLAVATTPSRVAATLAGFIGLMAVLVAAVGLHGIVAQSVVARTREIGIRVALGAPKAALLRVVAGSSLTSVGIGALIGGVMVTGMGLALSTEMRAALFGLNPLDPLAYALAVVSLAIVVSGAVYLPARRALGMAPLDALRHDA
jgi:putative ABC transport system permease protein